MLEEGHTHPGLFAGRHRSLGQALELLNGGRVVSARLDFGLCSPWFIFKQRFEQGIVAALAAQACGICDRNKHPPKGRPCDDCNPSSDQRQGAILHGHGGLDMAIMLAFEIACSMPLIRFIRL